MLSQSRAKQVCKNFSHSPESQAPPINERIPEGSWLTKKTVSDLVAIRNSEYISQASEFIVGSIQQLAIDYE